MKLLENIPEETLNFIAEADYTAMVGKTQIRATKRDVATKIFSFSTEEIVATVLEEVRKRNKESEKNE